MRVTVASEAEYLVHADGESLKGVKMSQEQAAIVSEELEDMTIVYLLDKLYLLGCEEIHISETELEDIFQYKRIFMQVNDNLLSIDLVDERELQ